MCLSSLPRRFMPLALLLAASTAHAAPRTMTGAELALRWPELLGEVVKIQATPLQALDIARYHIKVDKTDAVMLVMPGKIWTGTKTVCAMVNGPEKMFKAGRTQVVGLMLTDCP